MKKIVLALVLCIIILFTGYQTFTSDTAPESIKPGWEYLDGVTSQNQYSNPNFVLNTAGLPWTSMTFQEKPKYKSPEGEVWLRVVLPSATFNDPCIYFMTYDQNFQIYFENKLVRNFGGFDADSKKESPGSFWHIIDLPKDYAGKYVYIRMYSAREANHGLVKAFELCSHSAKLTYIIRDGLFPFVHASMYVFVGFFALCFSLIKRTNKKTFLYLACSAVATGFWLIGEGYVKQLFISETDYSSWASLWVYIDLISQYSIPIFYALFINELFENRNRKILTTMAYIHIAILFGSLLVDAMNLMPLVATINAFYITFGVNMAIMIFVIMRSFKYWTIDIKIFGVGFSFLCLTGILDLLQSSNRSHTNIGFTRIGVFILLSSFSSILIYNIIKAQTSVTKYMDELNTKEEILTEKNKQLDAAMINEQLKNEFFSNISHELKTPLNIILSTIQLLNRYSEQKLITSTEKDIDRYLGIMKQNSYRLIRLVNNLIDMTKIDAGYLRPDMKNNDIVAVVEDITQSVADYIKRNGISITFDTDVEEKVIACDPEKIERIMLNLLSNAVKFSNPGSSILVDLKDHDSEIEIIVQDTGIGLDRDKLDVIFERFAQVDKSLTRNHEGSGIGLSLVKSLVEMHDGKIHVESEYGKGSTFRITLPARLAEHDEKEYDENEIHAVHVEKVNIEFSDIYS